MNSLNSNPKSSMFYAAAQNLLKSNQNSVNNLHRQLPFTDNSMLNLSDRSIVQQIAKPRRLDILVEMGKIQRERSLSNLRNSSLDRTFEQNPHAYNIRGRFQLINESQERIREKESQKLELKDYLLKQIEEKRKQQYIEQENKRIADKKDDERCLRQLQDINDRQKSIEAQNQGSFIKNVVQAKPNNQQNSNNPQLLQIYRTNSLASDSILQKLVNIQNDLQLMQTVKTATHTDMQEVRNSIKQQIRKQVSPTKQTEHIGKILYESQPKVMERQLDCETIFIPYQQALQTDLDKLSETQEEPKQQQQQQYSFPQSHHLRQTNQSPIQNKSIVPIKNKSNNSKQEHSFHSQIGQIPNTNQSINNGSILINQSRLTISQLTVRDQSKSQEKRLESKQKKERDQKLKEEEEKKLKILKLKYPKIPHRTTMLMQMPNRGGNDGAKK